MAEASYQAVTSSIRVTVVPRFDQSRSSPDESRYFWLYTIEITNESQAVVRLLSRHWQITDANGGRDEVRGPGVVGQMPVLEPGESFTYTSGCPLSTPSGIMVGTYEMVRADGARFEVAIPAFSLDLPDARPVVN